MKDYILFYDNQETQQSGYITMQFIGDPFRWVMDLWDSVNPTTTFTLVEV